MSVNKNAEALKSDDSRMDDLNAVERNVVRLFRQINNQHKVDILRFLEALLYNQ